MSACMMTEEAIVIKRFLHPDHFPLPVIISTDPKMLWKMWPESDMVGLLVCVGDKFKLSISTQD